LGARRIALELARKGSALALTAIMYSLVCLTAIVVWAAGGLSRRPKSIQSIPLPA